MTEFTTQKLPSVTSELMNVHRLNFSLTPHITSRRNSMVHNGKITIQIFNGKITIQIF